MKYLSQFAIICMVAFGGEVLARVIPMQVPGVVWGIAIMFLLLVTRLVKLSHVDETSMFLISILPILLVPLAVALIEIIGDLRAIAVPLILILFVSTALTLLVSGMIAQALLKKRGSDE